MTLSISGFGSLLIASLLETNQVIGQCKIGTLDAEGICEPNIKLKPEYCGCGCGRELWPTMIDYAFTHSAARIVQKGARCQIFAFGVIPCYAAFYDSSITNRI